MKLFTLVSVLALAAVLNFKAASAQDDDAFDESNVPPAASEEMTESEDTMAEVSAPADEAPAAAPVQRAEKKAAKKEHRAEKRAAKKDKKVAKRKARKAAKKSE